MSVNVNDNGNKLDLKSIIGKLTSNSYLFKGIKDNIILEGLRSFRISIVNFKAGHKVINEDDDDCRFFYLLLMGSVGIYKNKVKICDINKISLIGELGFINKNIKRTATVLVHEESYLMKFEQGFIDNLSLEHKLTIYKNISKEISFRLDASNKIIVGKANCDESVNHIEQIIKDSVFTTID